MTTAGYPDEPMTIVRAPGGFVLSCSQWPPQPITTVFPFFADAHNLERLTPPFLQFRIVSMSTPRIERGTPHLRVPARSTGAASPRPAHNC